MITVTMDQSVEDDYFVLSHISVEIEHQEEKRNIEKRFELINGSIVDPWDNLKERLAKHLEVDINLIELDTENIDIMQLRIS